MSGGMLILTITAVLVFSGLLQRVLDRMYLTDRQALLLIGLMIAGTFLPDLQAGFVRINIGGAVIPLGVCIWLLIKADQPLERWRSLFGALATAAAVYAISRLMPSEAEALPFDPKDATIYYAGPTPAKPGQVIGSAGPTTSGRMDAYAPTMMAVGARGMIGKGARLPEVVEAMKQHCGVYFGAIGGAGALLSKCIKKCELIAYEDLGAEALRKLYVEDFPVFVIIDCYGNNLYETGRENYLKIKEK